MHDTAPEKIMTLYYQTQEMLIIGVDVVHFCSSGFGSKSGHVWKSILLVEPSHSHVKYFDRHLCFYLNRCCNIFHFFCNQHAIKSVFFIFISFGYFLLDKERTSSLAQIQSYSWISEMSKRRTSLVSLDIDREYRALIVLLRCLTWAAS